MLKIRTASSYELYSEQLNISLVRKVLDLQPISPWWCASIIHSTIVAKSPWDTYKNMMKNYSRLNFFIFAPYTYPHSPQKVSFRLWDTSHCCARKIFPLPHVLLTKNNIVLGGGGMKFKCRIKKCKVSQDFWRLL